ncbi:hypothetical protein PV10_04093 [Exophiala mesophila]|uniref:NADH:flavin oxidoreductase/NADH oxidase N-terminal domain-containing protein n=1 Tax=Exophiala mesophila TaxID=212818 RepID=A0A0D2A189_EXOME|nr:uncharacterized protein PV10_04093 [Exophiala mesophila]KIV92828.1 hypothetical protein PV10_04093 [Exophiala mesophila]
MRAPIMTPPQWQDSKLFKPLQIGQVKLAHRMVMAPMTRFRADDAYVPLPFATTYYTQRASVPGTLIITEGTLVSENAGGYTNVPGIWSETQIEEWRKITKAVHDQGSYIVLQLWSLGRTADPTVASRIGIKFASSSAQAITPGATPVPAELTRAEIQGLVQDHAKAAWNAVMKAGFDGVEIHGANGYLIDQFTQNVCNTRTDEYGGSVENRSRFALEVAAAVVAAVGADKVGIRLSPYSTFQGMGMKNPRPQFTHLLQGLRQLKLAFIHLVESRVSGNADVEEGENLDFAIDAWADTSPIIIAGGFRAETARKAVDEQYPARDIAIAFGRSFTSNPDLPFRIRKGIDVVPYDRDTFYSSGLEEGYIDYRFCPEFERESRV